MARIRTVKPDFFGDEKMAKQKRDARLIYIGLWVFADDYGTVRSNPVWIKSNIFPYDEELRVSDVKQWLDALVKARMLEPFEYNGEGFYNIRTFGVHQRVDKPSKPIVPLDAKAKLLVNYPSSSSRTLAEYSTPDIVLRTEEVVNSKGDGPPSAPAPDPGREKRKRRENFIPPTRNELQNFFIEKMGGRWGEAKAKMVADECCDFYTANGWVQGKGKPIVDWQATCRNWIRREIGGEFSNSPPVQLHNKLPDSRAQPPTPHSAKPDDKVLTEEQKELLDQEYINDLFSEFLAGSLRIEFIPTAHYEYLKKKGLMRMSQHATDVIKEKARADRINELKASTAPADIKLLSLYQSGEPCDEVTNDKGFLKLAKRLALIEFFTQLKNKSETHVFKIPNPEACGPTTK